MNGDSNRARPLVGPAAPARGLLKMLGVGFGIAVLVGNTIGMGILRTPGEVAAHLPSVPLFVAVWVAGALYALLGALTVAELGAANPRSGGLYPLVHDILGPFPGFVAGWTDWLVNCGSAAAVAIVMGEYLGPLVPALADHQKLVASLILVGLAALQWGGMRLGNVVQQAATLVKGLALVGLAGVALYMSRGMPAPNPASGTPAAMVPQGSALAVAVVVALQSAIYTYDGWTGPVYFGEEVKEPGRDIPRSMISGVLVVMVIYLVMNAAFLRIVPIQDMAGDPFVAGTAAKRLFGPMGDPVLRVIMLVSMVAAVNAMILMYSRITFAMSADGFLPPILRRVTPGGTPGPSLVIGTVLAIGLIATNTFDSVLALLAFFMVANYALTYWGFFAARRRHPDAERPFRVPGYPWVPGAALLGSVAFLVAAVLGDPRNSLAAIGMVALSWPVSRAVGRRDRG